MAQVHLNLPGGYDYVTRTVNAPLGDDEVRYAAKRLSDATKRLDLKETERKEVQQRLTKEINGIKGEIRQYNAEFSNGVRPQAVECKRTPDFARGTVLFEPLQDVGVEPWEEEMAEGDVPDGEYPEVPDAERGVPQAES